MARRHSCSALIRLPMLWHNFPPVTTTLLIRVQLHINFFITRQVPIRNLIMIFFIHQKVTATFIILQMGRTATSSSTSVPDLLKRMLVSAALDRR